MDTQDAEKQKTEGLKPKMSFMPLVPPQDVQTSLEQSKQPVEPAAPTEPAPATPTPDATAKAADPATHSEDATPAKPARADAKPESDLAKEIEDLISPLPKIDIPHVGLHVNPDKIKHKIVISLVSDDERFGDVEEIEVDMADHAYYSAAILMPKDQVAKLSIVRQTGSRTQNYDYELTRVHHGINGEIIVQSDDNAQKNIRDFGETFTVRVRNPKTGEIHVIQKPLYRKVEGEHPVYIVKKIDGNWTASFETEIERAFYQMREERKLKDQKRLITEKEFVEYQEGVNFNTLRQELFSSLLATPEVQEVISDLGIEVRVDDIISISSYITIEASSQAIETTNESH